MLFGPSNSISSSREGKKLIAFTVALIIGIGAYLYYSFGERKVEKHSLQTAGEEQPVGRGAPLALPDVPSEDDSPEPVVPVDPDVDMSVFEDNEIRDKSQMIEKPYLFKLLKTVNETPAADLRARAVRAEFNEFFNNPEVWRGKVLRIEGMIRKIAERRSEDPPEGIDVLYEAQITDKNRYWYYVFIIGKPEFKEDDLVAFDGAFMKIYSYKTIKGTLLHAPLLVCKGFERMVIPPWRPYSTIGWGVLVVVLLGGAAAVFIYQSQKSDSEVVSRRVEQKRIERVRAWAESNRHAGDEQSGSGDDGPTEQPETNEEGSGTQNEE